MISFLSNLRTRGKTSPDVFAAALKRQIHALESGSLRCHIPRRRNLYESHAKMQYHFKPEIFLQLGGLTEFTFPHESLMLESGSICIVPKGMPHGEFVRAEREPFENVVISYYSGMIDIHLAHEVAPGEPGADAVYLYTTDLFDDLVSYVDRICELHDSARERNELAIKGLLLAEFALLLSLVETRGAHRPSTTDTVSLCQWLIQHNIQEEELSVQSLADEIGCSPGHLSKLFHRTTGERLVERINRLRIRCASDALVRTRLSVKSIAAACGFGDAAYFARVFRQATSRSPRQFRIHALRNARAPESRPQVLPPFHTDDPEPKREFLQSLGLRPPTAIAHRQ
ncbi:MAG TPA: helix-turn-helix transcriptional regulator [Opitutaceae bacterium]